MSSLSRISREHLHNLPPELAYFCRLNLGRPFDPSATEGTYKEHLRNIVVVRDPYESLQLLYRVMIQRLTNQIYGIRVDRGSMSAANLPRSPVGYYLITYMYNNDKGLLDFAHLIHDLGYRAQREISKSRAYGGNFTSYGETYIERVRPKPEDINWSNPRVIELAREMYYWSDDYEHDIVLFGEERAADCYGDGINRYWYRTGYDYPPSSNSPYEPESILPVLEEWVNRTSMQHN
jgi:hypothetical protein